MENLRMVYPPASCRYGGEIEDWEIERTMTREEKIAFVDEHWNKVKYCPCSLSDYLKVKAEFEKAVTDKVIKGKWVVDWTGEKEYKINSNSYLAWVKKVNARFEKGLLSDCTYFKVYGFADYLKITDDLYGRTEFGYTEKYTGKDIVDQIFYEFLKKLCRLEKEHFEATNTKEIKITKCRDFIKKGYPSFIPNIWDACFNDKKHLVTEEMLDIAIAAYEKMDKAISDIEEEVLEQFERV